MHVAPVDLRTLRQDGIVIRFSTLGAMAYALAEIPASGTSGTSLERPCTDPHWGFVIQGQLTFVTDDAREEIPAGRAFHVPAGGPSHRFETNGAAIIAGFAPVEPDLDLSDRHLVARGFELVKTPAPATIVPVIAARPARAGEIRAETWPMSQYQLTRVRMGERSGYTAAWCDAPHWGLVTAGRLAIEWEDDVEILSPGDAFHCPAGPPGHRVEATDPAAFIDLTPVSALSAGGRLAEWRRAAEPVRARRASGIAVAALG